MMSIIILINKLNQLMVLKQKMKIKKATYIQWIFFIIICSPMIMANTDTGDMPNNSNSPSTIMQDKTSESKVQITIPLKEDKGQRRKIKITADKANYDVKKGIIRYIGNASLKEDDFSIQADTITAYTKDKQITNVVIIGLKNKDVTFSHHPKDKSQKPLFGRGKTLSYQPGYDVINIDGNARIDYDGSYITGQHIEYSLDPATPAIISGRVYLKQKDDESIMTLQSDQMIAFFNTETKKIIHTIASNYTYKPVLVEYTPLKKSDNKPAYGEALIIEYFAQEKLLKMKNEVLIISDGTIIEGDSMQYYTMEDNILVQSNNALGDTTALPVKFFIPPEKKENAKNAQQ